MATFVERGQAPFDKTFRSRCLIAAKVSAIQVLGEPAATVGFVKRYDLAVRIVDALNIDDPVAWQVAWYVASWAALTDPLGASDSALADTVYAGFNDLAHVSALDTAAA